MNYLIEYVTGFSMLAGPMGNESPPCAPPVHTAIDAKGLAAFQPASDGDAALSLATDWDALDREVQDTLSRLTARVLAQQPEATWKAGRTTARAFALFTYRVFYRLDGNDDDPVVVGVTFAVCDAKVRVAGDVSGDESGFVYYDEDCTLEVPAEPLAVRQAARVVADRLASQDAILLDAIRNRHPRASAR